MRISSKKLVIALVIIIALIIGVFIYASSKVKPPVEAPVVVVENHKPKHDVIGQSVDGRDIDAYTYSPLRTSSTIASSSQLGNNDKKHLLFVGGIHGGYEWNSVFLAYKFMDYLEANPSIIPENIVVTVIPSANPDAVFAVVGKEGRFDPEDVSTSTKILEAARFNSNEVDLNRNFDCKWQPKSTWRTVKVSAGKAAFSEPEAIAIRDLVKRVSIDAAIFWHSKSNAVYASQCNDGILPGTLSLMNTYSKASGYPAVETFDAYVTTGAADDWLASIGVPAITVELKTHETIEWTSNLAGVKAVFDLYK